MTERIQMRQPAAVKVDFLVLAQDSAVDQESMGERAAEDDACWRGRRLVLGEFPR